MDGTVDPRVLKKIVYGKDANAERWITEACYILRAWFEFNGFRMRGNVHCMVGFSPIKRAVGTTHFPLSSRNGMHTIFISPTFHKPVPALETLVHEMCHVVAGAGVKHGAGFKVVALGVGLRGPMASTPHTTPELAKHLSDVAEALGPYPYGGLYKR